MVLKSNFSAYFKNTPTSLSFCNRTLILFDKLQMWVFRSLCLMLTFEELSDIDSCLLKKKCQIKLTLTRASVRFVHIAISSLVLISGYLFLAKVASSSCNCCDVKCVLCLLCRLFFLSFLLSSESLPSTPTTSVFTSASDRLPIGRKKSYLINYFVN